VDNLDEMLDTLKVNCYPLRIECAHRLELEEDNFIKDLFGRSVPAGEYFKVDISIEAIRDERDPPVKCVRFLLALSARADLISIRFLLLILIV